MMCVCNIGVRMLVVCLSCGVCLTSMFIPVCKFVLLECSMFMCHVSVVDMTSGGG